MGKSMNEMAMFNGKVWVYQSVTRLSRISFNTYLQLIAVHGWMSGWASKPSKKIEKLQRSVDKDLHVRKQQQFYRD